MQRIFAAHMEADRSVVALAEARAIAVETRARLLCFEHDHAHCHSTLVADMLVGDGAQPIQHLFARIDLPPPTRKARKTA